MRMPAVRGTIRRRLLVNFRVDPAVLRRQVPAPFELALHAGWGMAGICLIRLEGIRFPPLPAALGVSSENAAHRVAVRWREGADWREGVYIWRRDTDSALGRLVGGRLFPGVHGAAWFDVDDDGSAVSLKARCADGLSVDVEGHAAPALPASSVFGSLAESSSFYERGSVGWSATPDADRYDGLALAAERWRVEAFATTSAASSFFSNAEAFPAGSVELDHALVMRDVAHAWNALPDLRAEHAAVPQRLAADAAWC